MKFFALFMAAYMSVGSLFPRTDFSQLMRLANVTEHYRQHLDEARATGTDFSFLQFINIHFIQPDGHQHPSSPQSHHQLPLHSVCTCHFLISPASGLPELPGLAFYRSAASFSQERLTPRGYAFLVFHPPISA